MIMVKMWVFGAKVGVWEKNGALKSILAGFRVLVHIPASGQKGVFLIFRGDLAGRSGTDRRLKRCQKNGKFYGHSMF